MKRQSGVLMHVSSLGGEYSIGSFGEEALRFIDFLSDGGFGVWQVLPFGMTDSYNSPYKSSASFGANPYFIDLPTLYNKGYITASELEAARQREPYLCEFERLGCERVELLSRAAVRMRERGEELFKMRAFLSESPQIASAANFLALRDKNGGAPWQEWTDFTPDAERLFVWEYIQYEFYSQWSRVKEYANMRGISIIGDLPIYVDLDSADVYSARSQFQLDSDGYPTRVAGVPPDAFSADGQLWGNPLYDWKEMKRDGYSWWRRRIEHALTLFDGVRIDHFRAFESYFSIPSEAESARAGKWVKGPGRALIDVIKRAAGDRLIIAEDLGVITDRVRSLVDYSGFYGMRVFQFGFLESEDNLHLPHNYPGKCVSYTGTHDNNTLLGYLFELDDATRERIYAYCGTPRDDISSACLDVIRTMLASHSDLTIFPIQDLLFYGRDTRMNTPGVARGNWAYRILESQLASIDTARLRELNRLYFRN